MIEFKYNEPDNCSMLKISEYVIKAAVALNSP